MGYVILGMAAAIVGGIIGAYAALWYLLRDWGWG